MPSLEARKWRRDAAEGKSFRPPSSRTIQSWRSRLVDLGLIEAMDHGQFWVIRFRFSLATIWSVLELRKGGKVSGPSLMVEGDSPTGNPPEGSEDPTGEAGPAAALEAAPPAGHELTSEEARKVAEATEACRDEIRRQAERLAQVSLSGRRNRSWTESEKRQKAWEAKRLAEKNSRTAGRSAPLTGRNGPHGPRGVCLGHGTANSLRLEVA